MIRESTEKKNKENKKNKKGKLRIAFDLDGVVIDKPPLVSKKILEWLFRGGKRDGLSYRFPTTRWEQGLRKLSHFYLFRPPMEKNIQFIERIVNETFCELYAVSARYAFLEEETKNWLKKRKIEDYFKKIYLNLDNEQPHLYKEKILKKLLPDLFIEDDGLIADYLSEKLPRVKIFCCVSKGEGCFKATPIVSLEELPIFK